MSVWGATGLFTASWLAACAVLLPLTLRLLPEAGLVGLNYARARIPVGLGLFIWACAAVEWALAGAWVGLGLPLPVWLKAPPSHYWMPLTIVFFAGLIDDAIGDTRVKGLRGHLAALFARGVVTTGLFKAAAVAAASLWAAGALADSFAQGAVMFGVMLLSANGVNLLDVRPARALKAFFALGVLLFAAAPEEAPAWLVPPAVGALLVFRHDRKAQAMLGDMGANPLGFCLGFAACRALPWWGLAIWLTLAAGLHWTAERRSITRLIEENRWLAWLDRLGRGG